MYRMTKNGRQRILRSVYECGVFQTLRDKLRCKEIWVTGADKWRNPDEDLPTDFDANRVENYQKLRKPLAPTKFVAELREEMDAELSALPKLDWLQITERKSGPPHRRGISCSPGSKPTASTTPSSSPTAATPPAPAWRSTATSPSPTPSTSTTASSTNSPCSEPLLRTRRSLYQRE